MPANACVFWKENIRSVCFGFEQSLLIVFLLRFGIVQVTLRRWMVGVLEFGHQVTEAESWFTVQCCESLGLHFVSVSRIFFFFSSSSRHWLLSERLLFFAAPPPCIWWIMRTCISLLFLVHHSEFTKKNKKKHPPPAHHLACKCDRSAFSGFWKLAFFKWNAHWY